MFQRHLGLVYHHYSQSPKRISIGQRDPDVPSNSWAYFWKKVFDVDSQVLDDQDASKLYELCDNAYWSRLWILQEVGRARKLSVHFYEFEVAWERFIHVLRRHIETIHELGSRGECVKAARDFNWTLPVKLEQQREERYLDGHKLQNLLESHRDALCKDPRVRAFGCYTIQSANVSCLLCIILQLISDLDSYHMLIPKTMFIGQDIWVDRSCNQYIWLSNRLWQIAL